MNKDITFDIKFSSSSTAGLAIVLGFGLAVVTLVALLSRQSLVNLIVLIVSLFSLITIAGLVPARYRNGRLSCAPPQVTILSKSTFEVGARYAIKRMEFGDCVVRLKVRRLGIPSAFNVRFSLEAYEGFKRLVEHDKPTILVCR